MSKPISLNQKSGVHMLETESGHRLPLHVPNDTIHGEGFYISYNAHDSGIYGSDTTALVVGQMEAFYILNGDHMGEYFRRIGAGFEACLEYFEENIEQINKYSEQPPARAPKM